MTNVAHPPLDQSRKLAAYCRAPGRTWIVKQTAHQLTLDHLLLSHDNFKVPFTDLAEVSTVPHYSIRVSGAFSVGAGLQLGITGFEIQDTDSRTVQAYTFIGGGVSYSPVPIGATIISDWSDFDSPCGLRDFEGAVTVTDASVGRGLSHMIWSSGKPAGLTVVTSGWEVSIPGGSASLGYLRLDGASVKVTETGKEARWIALAIYHPLYPRGQRYLHWRNWAKLWGYLSLNMWDYSGFNSGSGSSWQWRWNPIQPPHALPVELMTSKEGYWCLGGGAARLTGPLDFTLTGLEPAIFTNRVRARVVDQQTIFTLLNGAPDDSDDTGKVSGGSKEYSIIWTIAGFKLTPR